MSLLGGERVGPPSRARRTSRRRPDIRDPAMNEGAPRLHIVKGEADTYVYRLVEAGTGRLLAELARAQVDQLNVLDHEHVRR